MQSCKNKKLIPGKKKGKQRTLEIFYIWQIETTFKNLKFIFKGFKKQNHKLNKMRKKKLFKNQFCFYVFHLPYCDLPVFIILFQSTIK